MTASHENTQEPMPAVGAICTAVLFSFILGVIGGGILAGPFWFFGLIVGAMYAPPVGLGIGLFAAFLRWPAPCILDACGCQFVGALALGFGALALDGDPGDYANIGQIAGAAVGVIVADHLSRRPRRRPCECRTCGYDLTGNVSGVCPECGAKVVAETGSQPAACPHCGRDVTGNRSAVCNTLGICPECGERI